MENKIDWSRFEQQDSKFVKLIAGKPKTMKFESVSQTNEEIKDNETGITKIISALRFRITEEDGKPVDKEFTVLSKILAKQLRPIIEKGLPRVITITRFGAKYDTEYEIKLPKEEEDAELVQ